MKQKGKRLAIERRRIRRREKNSRSDHSRDTMMGRHMRFNWGCGKVK